MSPQVCKPIQLEGQMARTPLNVLVFPGGTEIGLEIQRALCHCKEVRLHSAGQDVSNHAAYVFARDFVVPAITEPNWLESLNQLVEELRIDYIFPAHDDVIVALLENADKIRARIVSSPLETCRITRSKTQTYQHLKGVVPVPGLYPDLCAVPQYPVFVKPDKGQGSQHTHIVQDENRLHRLLADRSDCIVAEYLPGEEFTIDCFSHRALGLLYCAGRCRVRTRNGISMSSRFAPENQDTFEQYARAISTKLTFYGAWFFQVKRDSQGALKLLEVAPRIAGTMALSRVRGINFALLSLYEQEGEPLQILAIKDDVEIDRALVNRYRHRMRYSAAYIDLDDTLILNGRVNVDLAAFLYQCVNDHVRLVLLTKHTGNVSETLQKFHLSGIFDEVVHLGRSAAKADYITEPDAILIDDSFCERKTVSERLGIRTFDASMLEMLMDSRQ